MTFRQLTYFSKIYECGNLLKAAEGLFLSQQALSRALSLLEQELGMPLFFRSHKGVTPTALGTELYAASRAVIAELDGLEHHIQEFVRLSSGQLKIGLAAGARYFTARTVWNDFYRKYPQISIQAKEYSYLTGLELLETNQLDVLTFSDYEAGDEYVQLQLHSWQRVLLVPKGHPLYEQEYATAQDLKGEHLAFCANPMIHRLLLQFCDEHDCRPADIVLVSDTLYMYQTCQAESCLGITIQGYFTDIFLPQFPELKALPFQGELFPYTISAIFRKGHPMSHTIADLANSLKASLQQL